MKVSGIIENPLGTRKAKIFAFLTDWRVFVPALLMAGYIIGIVAAFHIHNSVSIATVHQGPYAFVGFYKGKLYELIPMEEAVRLRQLYKREIETRRLENVIVMVE